MGGRENENWKEKGGTFTLHSKWNSGGSQKAGREHSNSPLRLRARFYWSTRTLFPLCFLSDLYFLSFVGVDSSYLPPLLSLTVPPNLSLFIFSLQRQFQILWVVWWLAPAKIRPDRTTTLLKFNFSCFQTTTTWNHLHLLLLLALIETTIPYLARFLFLLIKIILLTLTAILLILIFVTK